MAERWTKFAVGLVVVSLAGCGFKYQREAEARRAAMSPEEKNVERLESESRGVSFVRFNSNSAAATRPNLTPDQILLTSGVPQNRRHEELGSLSISRNVDTEELVRLIRIKASLVGADAVMQFEVDEVPTKTFVYGDVDRSGNASLFSNQKSVRRARGIAIRFKD